MHQCNVDQRYVFCKSPAARDNRLLLEMHWYWHSAYAQGTNASYKAKQRKWFDFCERFDCQALPARECDVMAFVAWRARTVAPGTIKSDLSALRHLHVENGFSKQWKLDEWDSLHRIMRGIKRIKGDSSRDNRLPVTVALLHRFHRHLLKPLSYDTLVVFVAMCTGTYGLLRSGEFVVSSKHTTPLLLRQITINDDHMVIKLEQSKTDPFRKGVSLHIGANGSATCPVKLWKSMLLMRRAVTAKRPQPHEPAFMLSNGKPLDKSLLVSTLKSWCSSLGIDCSKYNGHSFRIGGATSLAAANVPDSVIQTLGRWKSDCFKLYVRLPQHELHAYSGIMVDAATSRKS